MSQGASRRKILNPEDFISQIEELLQNKKLTSEVELRRAISAIYFSLFNYWSGIRYDRNIRGKGPNQDQFEYREFHEELLKEALDPQIITLYTYRVAADHYTLNPTKIKLYNKEIINIIKNKRIEIRINPNILEKVLNAARDILNYLNTNPNTS